uniref:Uncharacterized protein n=1 Tax=viral metagenome TaxID=1070528 RepID=A0A6C0CRZ5_9ZZZZ
MGIWTTNAGNNYKVNIRQDHISAMKAAGARFCWLKDNPGINNENNEIYFESSTINDDDGNNKEVRVRRENITVTSENGDRITGYVSHLVVGYHCMGTHIGDWFIIQEGTYPTKYKHGVKETEEIVVEDL